MSRHAHFATQHHTTPHTTPPGDTTRDATCHSPRAHKSKPCVERVDRSCSEGWRLSLSPPSLRHLALILAPTLARTLANTTQPQQQEAHTHSQPQELRAPQPAHGYGVPKNTVPAPPSRRMLTTRMRRPGLSCGRTSTDCSASLYGNTGMAGFGAEPGVASAPAPAPAPAPPAPARPSPATSLVTTFDEHVSSVGRDAGSQVPSAMDAVSDASTTYVMYTAP